MSWFDRSVNEDADTITRLFGREETGKGGFSKFVPCPKTSFTADMSAPAEIDNDAVVCCVQWSRYRNIL